MSSITINSNIASLNAQRRLGRSTASLQDSFTRLSSGLRINKAADDAAGLSIAESLKTDQRVFNQGVRNLNDGVSLLSIADGALNELSNITTRLAELAEQAANGALSNTQRGALDEEAQALKDEYLRIAQTTEFNGQKIFDGNFGELRLQAGYGEDGGIVSGVGGAIGSGSFSSPLSIVGGDGPRDTIAADFNGDGNLDLYTGSQFDNFALLSLGQGDGSFASATTVSIGATQWAGVAGDFNGDGILDVATAHYNDSSVSIVIGRGDGTFSESVSYAVAPNVFSIATGDINGDGVLDLVSASPGGTNTINVLYGTGSGTFASITTITGVAGPREVIVEDFNNDGRDDISSTENGSDSLQIYLSQNDGSFALSDTVSVESGPFELEAADFNNDGELDLVTANLNDGTISIAFGLGDGTFSASSSIAVATDTRSTKTGDFNGDGNTDVLVSSQTDDLVALFLGEGNGSFSEALTFDGGGGTGPLFLGSGDFNNDGVLDFFTDNFSIDAVKIRLGEAREGVSPLLEFSLDTQADARQALPRFKQKLDQLASQRGQIGAFEARLSTAVATTRVASENYASAESQISDADVAIEAATLVKNQILQQAGAAILSQANQGPALALALLG